MDEIKVEKDCPIPRKRGSIKYPWDEMQIGDSFALPYDEYAKRLPAFYQHAKRFGIKIISRRDRNANVLRVWRVE